MLFGHNPSQSLMVPIIHFRILPTVSPTTEEVLSCFVHAVIIVKNVAPKTPNDRAVKVTDALLNGLPFVLFGRALKCLC